MTFFFKIKLQNEIWQLVKNINNSWIKRQLENLTNLFHNDMVIVDSNFQELGKG